MMRDGRGRCPEAKRNDAGASTQIHFAQPPSIDPQALITELGIAKVAIVFADVFLNDVPTPQP
jgi:hypothetical protein